MRVGLHEGSVATLRSGWEQLFANDPHATPFSSHAWADAWLRHWAPQVRPWIVTVHEGPRLVGLAPFVLHRRGPLRLLKGLGEEPSDYWNVLAEPALIEDVLEAVSSELERRAGWDAIVLSHLPPGAQIGRALTDKGLAATSRPPDPYPGIVLPSTFEEYLSSLPQQRRTNLRRRLKHLDDGGIELRQIVDVEAIPAAVDRWQELRIRQWRERGMKLQKEHASPRFRSFLRDALAALLPAGLVAFWEFRDGERLVGSYVSFIDDRCFYQYLGGFDPAYGQLGIGKIAIGHGIRWSIEAGLSYYDFAFGAEPYKYWYGAKDQHCAAMLVQSGTARSKAAALSFFLRERLRSGRALRVRGTA